MIMRSPHALGLLALVAPLALAGVHSVPPAYTAAASANDVPEVVLYALALTESAVSLSYGRRPWPWTLNIAGDGERYPTRAAACRALQVALARTRVVDVGLGQLNVRWQRALFGDGGRFENPCTALNPYANLDAAAAILRDCFEQHGNWIEAAGCYHRPAGGAPAARYRRALRHALSRLRGGGLGTSKASKAVTRGRRAQRLVWINPTQPRNALE